MAFYFPLAADEFRTDDELAVLFIAMITLLGSRMCAEGRGAGAEQQEPATISAGAG